jgi:hypothetical protein
VLRDWALPELPARPRPSASSPARRRRVERAASKANAAALWAAHTAAVAAHARAEWEIRQRIVSPLSPRAIVNKHQIGPGKLRNFIFWGEPKVGERSDVHYWMARCLLERGVPPSEAFVLLRVTNWNKHKFENEYRWVEMTWRVIEKAWARPFVPWREQQQRRSQS